MQRNIKLLSILFCLSLSLVFLYLIKNVSIREKIIDELKNDFSNLDINELEEKIIDELKNDLLNLEISELEKEFENAQIDHIKFLISTNKKETSLDQLIFDDILTEAYYHYMCIFNNISFNRTDLYGIYKSIITDQDSYAKDNEKLREKIKLYCQENILSKINLEMEDPKIAKEVQIFFFSLIKQNIDKAKEEYKEKLIESILYTKILIVENHFKCSTSTPRAQNEKFSLHLELTNNQNLSKDLIKDIILAYDEFLKSFASYFNFEIENIGMFKISLSEKLDQKLTQLNENEYINNPSFFNFNKNDKRNLYIILLESFSEIKNEHYKNNRKRIDLENMETKEENKSRNPE